MGDVIDIRKADSREPASPTAIEVLREALEQAEKGEILAVGMAIIHRNGEIGTRTSSSNSFRHALVAGAAYLQHDLVNESD